MLEAVLTTISRYNMLGPGRRVIAAVSGGPDSVCLLEVLRRLEERLGFELAGVAHLNHKLRGEASDEDEHFVAALAARHRLPFYAESAEIPQSGANLEQAARRARLAFFGRLIREGKADRVATGHTRDDQAETVLFRFLRGSGLAGLAGILPATREGLIRPLLEVSRADVELFLEAQGLSWREDSTNADARFSRNRIRHVLLPQLEAQWNPELRAGLARLADLAAGEEKWWQRRIARLAGRLLVERDGGLEIQTSKLRSLHPAVARRLVRRMIRQAAGRSAGFDHVERILELAVSPRGSGCVEAPGLRIIRSFGWLRVEGPGIAGTAPQTVPVRIPGKYQWTGGAVCFELASDGGGTSQSGDARCARLKWKEQGASAVLELRGWKDGDRYRPLGRTRVHSIKEMFQQARVPSWRRDFWPIVTDGCNILWAREFGPAAALAAEPGAGTSLCIWEEPRLRNPSGT